MRRRAVLAAVLFAVGVPTSAVHAEPEPYVLELELKARFENPEFGRDPFLASLAVLQFADDQTWAQEFPSATRLDLDGDAVEGRATLRAPTPPDAGAVLSFTVGGERFDLALDGAEFTRVELATGVQWQARLPVVLQLGDPEWVGFGAELIEIEGLRPRLQVRIENRSPEPYALPALRIRAERRRIRRPDDCSVPPEAELPRVQWHWQAATGTARDEGMSVVRVRVGGCEIQWMALDIPLEREIASGSDLRLMVLPLVRAAGGGSSGRDARVDGLAGWDSVRVSVTPPGRELPPEITVLPGRRSP